MEITRRFYRKCRTTGCLSSVYTHRRRGTLGSFAELMTETNLTHRCQVEHRRKNLRSAVNGNSATGDSTRYVLTMKSYTETYYRALRGKGGSISIYDRLVAVSCARNAVGRVEIESFKRHDGVGSCTRSRISNTVDRGRPVRCAAGSCH